MLVNRSEDREIFLRYIINTYLKNPTSSVSCKNIYGELSRFNVINGECSVLNRDSLISVQVSLNNKYRNNKKVNTFTSRDGYFWAIENRMDNSDKEFFDKMYNSIKLYISIDLDNIYKVSESLFNFMIKENIVMQCKISKTMRNDAFVCRVATLVDARKVCDYLNGISYEGKIKCNPFLLDNGNVGIAMDGKLTYNTILSILLEQYLNSMNGKNLLDRVNSSDFSEFVKNQKLLLEGVDNKYYLSLYDINDKKKLSDCLMIFDLITKNLDNSLTFDYFGNYSDVRNDSDYRINTVIKREDEDKFLYVVNGLSNYYSVSDVHKIIMKFIETGDYNLFTRRDDIRNVVIDNFTKENLYDIVCSLGYDSFISASLVTYEKYGEEQLFLAIKMFFAGEGINSFTNDRGVRSRLGLVVPYEILKKKLISKLEEKGLSISSISLAMFVMDEIGNLDKKKNNSRK